VTEATLVWVTPQDGVPQCAWGIVKRTYDIVGSGLVRAEPEPLGGDIRNEDATPRWPPGSDYWPFKAVSDVAVLGKAFGPSGRPVLERQVSVRIGKALKRVQVFGDREVEWTDGRAPRFSAPERFAEMDLVYTRAYGGVDEEMLMGPPQTPAEMVRLMGDHPGAYPRNQSGKGYVVLDVPRQGLALPNLEDPDQLLTPESLITGQAEHWYRQPLSWFLDWHFPAMFPRSAYLGLEPWFPMPQSVSAELAEVRRGLMPERWRELAGDIGQLGRIPPIYYQEASLGMAFRDLKEGTPVEIVGMDPELDRMSFALPSFPRLEIDVEGDRQAVETKLLHAVITPHERKVELTWSGIRADLPRPFFPGLHGVIPITLFSDGSPTPFETPEPIYEKLKRAEEQGLLDVRPKRRKPGEPGYTEIVGLLLPEGRPDRVRDQVASGDSPTWGAVDAAAGRVAVSETDWHLPGHVPFAFTRHYSSSMAWRAGSLGLGWSHCLEQALWEQDGWLLYRMEDGREVGMPLPGGELGLGATVHHPNAGATIHRLASDAYAVRLDDGRRFGFTVVDESVQVGARKARLTEIVGPDGAKLSVHYDAHGRLDRMMLASGNYVRFEHDERGRLTRVFAPTEDSRGNAVAAAFTVDASGQLREVLDGAGRKTTYRYRGPLLSERTLPVGERTRFEYDGRNAKARCVAERWGEDEKVREVSWNPGDRIAGPRTATGKSFSMKVTERFGVERVLDYFANELTRTFDEASGMVTSQTTADGETTFMYDAAYHLADVSAPDAGSVLLEHDDEGRLTSERDADGHTLTARWDHLGRLTAVTERDGASVVYSYAEEGPLASILTPSELRIELERDAAGKAVVALASPLGSRRVSHDSLSRPSEVTDEAGAKQALRYDPSGRVKEHRLPADVRVTYESDADGRVTSVHDGVTSVELERDADGRVTHVDEGGGAGPRLHRDAEGRVTMFESEDFDFWELHRDAAGRLIEESGWAGEALYLHRDHGGRITRSTRGRVRATVKRDGAGRPVEIEHFDESFQRFAWTAGGRLSRAQYADRVVTFERDGEGRLTKESADGREVTSRYDATGRRLALDSSLGLRVRIDRDAMGNATKLRATLGEQALELAFERDVLGRERRRRLPGNLELRWRRDELGRAVRRAVCFGDKELASLETTWAGRDRITAVRESQRGARPHTHDARGRLVKAGGLIRALDPLGRVFRDPAQDDHSYEGARLVESYGNTYAYDAAGRRLSRTSVLDEQTRYAWDGLGRLIEVHLPEGDRITYDYDGLGRMTRRRRESKMEIPGLDEPVWEATRETELVWDGLALLHEIEGSKVTTWIRESGVLVGKLATDGAWAALTDALGVVTELTDVAGNVAWRGAIDAYGTLALDAAQTDQPWRFAGHWEDPDTGLQHSWWRVYDPETGGYLSPNPLGIVAGSNLYEYLPDPLSHTSPLGLARGYATLGGALAGERLEGELVERFVAALDRGDGAAGPRACFDREAAAWRLPDPQAVAWGPWDRFRPARRMPPSSRRYTRLPKHLGLSADDSPR